MKRILPVLIFALVASAFLPKQADVTRNPFASTHKSKKPLVILIDVNETLLDLSPLKEKINGVLDIKKVSEFCLAFCYNTL